ncbi:MAG: ABC transporter ATP-binding protein [Actinomycetota bacterium]
MTMTTTHEYVPSSGTPAAMIEFRAVTKTFGDGPSSVRALVDVDLVIPAGEFVTVMGPSGCGKSTLLHLVGAIEVPTAGVVAVGGADVAGLPLEDQARLRRVDIGYVFQSLNLIPSLSAAENVMLPLELDGETPRAARTAAEAALAQVGIDHEIDRAPDEFSGGQRQRIAIARAIVGDRRILLADEPTGALDTATGDGVVELLARLSNEHGVTVLMVTHEPRFSSWADRTVFLRDGVVVDDTGDSA